MVTSTAERPATETADENRAGPPRAVLISPYELGRQPFGLAQPAAWLAEEGYEVHCVDLTLDRLDEATLARAALVAVHLPMHTATRIAVEALPRIRVLAPAAHLCVYGLYAPMNEALFRGLGAGTVLGGEIEPALASLARRLRDGEATGQTAPVISLGKMDFRVPARAGLPALDRYASLVLPDGSTRTVAFAEASRGCRHLCRHCPVVPVYAGRFRVVPVDIVMADVRQQVAAGALHVSFGDPDFLNGPGHARRIVRALHAEFPELTWDATVKVEHIVNSAPLVEEFARAGCLFLTSAVEAVDETILAHLDKGHTVADFERAVAILRAAGIAMAPTFVAFTPWTTLEGYLALLEKLIALRLVESVPPIQLAIRLLVPGGSWLFRLPGFESLVGTYDETLLGHPWRHPDPRVDALHARVQSIVEAAGEIERPRRATFEAIWTAAHQAADRPPPGLPDDLGRPIPRHSEPWYCCAEPTGQQLAGF